MEIFQSYGLSRLQTSTESRTRHSMVTIPMYTPSRLAVTYHGLSMACLAYALSLHHCPLIPTCVFLSRTIVVPVFSRCSAIVVANLSRFSVLSVCTPSRKRLLYATIRSYCNTLYLVYCIPLQKVCCLVLSQFSRRTSKVT